MVLARAGVDPAERVGLTWMGTDACPGLVNPCGGTEGSHRNSRASDQTTATRGVAMVLIGG